ncbi:Hypothetical predicted protein [Paramuricea clavata]|uniref:Uncharacterized protein n=1 Tax=Paramuricea clavata TaxID=317549 RepID=A0A6S7GN69_PARCT|nr:Hypothetical predicted protein [Paramuricea clavata]
MPDKSNRKRHRSDRTSSPSERSSSKDPENRGHRQDQHKRRRENNIDPGVNEDTLTKILAGVNDMKQQFVAWTTRVTAIEAKLNENSGATSQYSGEFDDDQLSIHPSDSPKEFDNINIVVNNPAIEAPLAGSLPPLDGVEPTNINEITNPNVVVSEEGTSCEFFDPESTSQRRWSPSDPFGKFLEKNMRRRLTLEQVNEIIGESSLPETEACVAPLLDKQILNYIPSSRKKFVEQRDKDLALIQRALLNSAGPLCCLHDRLENQDKISNEELLNTLQQSLCLLGSANHIVTTNRRKKILGAINPDKAQLADRDFPNAGKMLFGEDLPSLAAKHSELSRSLAKNLQKQPYSAKPHSSGGSPAAFVRPANKYNYSEPNQVRSARSGQRGSFSTNTRPSNFRGKRDQTNRSWPRQ